MEYTKDLILNVNVEDANCKIQKKRLKSSILNFIKKHKTLVITTISLSLFIAIDIALITNFMCLLTSI